MKWGMWNGPGSNVELGMGNDGKSSELEESETGENSGTGGKREKGATQ